MLMGHSTMGVGHEVRLLKDEQATSFQANDS